jgi:hypothetical protein
VTTATVKAAPRYATEDMAALGALATPKLTYGGNVVPLDG